MIKFFVVYVHQPIQSSKGEIIAMLTKSKGYINVILRHSDSIKFKPLRAFALNSCISCEFKSLDTLEQGSKLVYFDEG